MSRTAPTCAIVGGGLGGLVTYTTLRHGGLDPRQIAVGNYIGDLRPIGPGGGDQP